MKTTKTLSGVQAAVELGCSEREVRRRAERGEIERFRQGNKYLYRVETTAADTVDNPVVLRDSYIEARARLREAETLAKQATRGRFCYRLCLGAAVITVGILGGILALGFGLWKGRGAEIEAVRTHLAVTRQNVIEERARADAAEAKTSEAQQRIDELTREVIEALREPEVETPGARVLDDII